MSFKRVAGGVIAAGRAFGEWTCEGKPKAFRQVGATEANRINRQAYVGMP